MREPRRKPSAAARARLRRSAANRARPGRAGGVPPVPDLFAPAPGARSRPPAPFPAAPASAPAAGGYPEPERELSPPGADPAPDSILDAVRVAIVVLDTTGRIVLWSPAAEELLGWPSELLIGRKLAEFFGREKRSAPDAAPDSAADGGTGAPEGPGAEAAPEPDDAPQGPRMQEIVDQVLGGGGWRGSVVLRDSRDGLITLDARLSRLVDGDGMTFLLVRLADLARLQAVEHDLAVQDALFEQSPLGIAVFDRELRYVRVNETLARMNGVALEDHLGRTAGETLPEASADEVTAIQRQVMATGEPVVDLTVAGPHPFNPGFRSISYARLHDRAGQIIGITGTIMDVTDRYRAVAKVEYARRRLALLNELGARIGDLLDAGRIAQELADALVPTLADYSGVVLLQAVGDGDDLPRHPHQQVMPMLLMGASGITRNPVAEAVIRFGDRVPLTEGTVFARVLGTGVSELLDSLEALEEGTEADDPRLEAAYELGLHSMLVVPLRARGIVLGFMLLCRAGRREGFDRDEMAFADEIADRAGASLDNARLYARERAAALMLQRTLLPQTVPRPPGVEVGYRYIPGSSGTEVGGDWFDVVPLPDGRTALVVGDVMGHGLRAAATMGRLRTAVRTLAGLGLPPEAVLQHVHDLADDLAQGPDEALIATCVYAVYDPLTRQLTLAKAGHTAPILAVPGEPARLLELPSGTPLGVGGVSFESVALTVPENTLLLLYTDGLVESRTEDIDVGTKRLCDVLDQPVETIEDTCERILDTLERGQEPDDVALLLARLGRAEPAASAHQAQWTLTADPSAPSRARRLVRSTLTGWGVPDLSDVAELLVSELVTNAVRYSQAPIGLRLLKDRMLLVEVSDPLPDPPQQRQAARTDEGGRGLELVHSLADRWGTRVEGAGKVVWFEQSLPSAPPAPAS
nr:SpoIIE family protein phosphatase [Streptacidiphilus sp. PB12-B1b]